MIMLLADISNSLEPIQLLHTLLLETVSSNQGENGAVSKRIIPELWGEIIQILNKKVLC